MPRLLVVPSETWPGPEREVTVAPADSMVTLLGAVAAVLGVASVARMSVYDEDFDEWVLLHAPVDVAGPGLSKVKVQAVLPRRATGGTRGLAFCSLRFGPEHGVVPMAEQLRSSLAPHGATLNMVDMVGGGDIDLAVQTGIEQCDTFIVFGSAKYGEDTGNQACTYYESKFAWDRKKHIVLIRMIPFDQVW
jgi:hypothetical protein